VREGTSGQTGFEVREFRVSEASLRRSWTFLLTRIRGRASRQAQKVVIDIEPSVRNRFQLFTVERLLGQFVALTHFGLRESSRCSGEVNLHGGSRNCYTSSVTHSRHELRL